VLLKDLDNSGEENGFFCVVSVTYEMGNMKFEKKDEKSKRLRLWRLMKTRTIYIAMIVVWLAPGLNGAEPELSQLPGLTVHDGQLLLKGQPYSGIGANYFSLFYRTLKNPSDTSYEDGLRQLSEAQIPFVRFMACGFWPVDWDLYLRDRATYFKRLDSVVECAERAGVGLIASLFWHMPTVPDIVGEPMDQLGNPNSKTIAFIRQYTTEVVLRYRNSPAVWGWEFGNEYNLCVDLPNASKSRPRIVPRMKTALKRTERDELSSQAMLTAFAQFTTTVREHDKHRIIITGNSIPRPSAYHNTKEKIWKKDSGEQFREILLRDNPDPFDVISVHVYRNSGQANTGSVEELVETLRNISVRAKRPLFIGEFGAPATLGNAKERSVFAEHLKVIEANKVPLSAFWVFDHAGQNNTWNVTFDNKRRYMLKLVGDANRRMSR